MTLLLDTHALLWWLFEPHKISGVARKRMQGEQDIYVSAVSAFEIATKVRIGKLEGARIIPGAFDQVIADQNFQPLALTPAHADRAGSLEGPHRDPFDRLLAAQALIEGHGLVSNDKAFDFFGVERLW